MSVQVTVVRIELAGGVCAPRLPEGAGLGCLLPIAKYRLFGAETGKSLRE
jgi:hypothetical protein